MFATHGTNKLKSVKDTIDPSTHFKLRKQTLIDKSHSHNLDIFEWDTRKQVVASTGSFSAL